MYDTKQIPYHTHPHGPFLPPLARGLSVCYYSRTPSLSLTLSPSLFTLSLLPTPHTNSLPIQFPKKYCISVLVSLLIKHCFCFVFFFFLAPTILFFLNLYYSHVLICFAIPYHDLQLLGYSCSFPHGGALYWARFNSTKPPYPFNFRKITLWMKDLCVLAILLHPFSSSIPPPARHSWTCARSLFGARASPHPHPTRAHFTLLRTFFLPPSPFQLLLSSSSPRFLLFCSALFPVSLSTHQLALRSSNASSATFQPKCLRRRPPPARPSPESRERRRVCILL